MNVRKVLLQAAFAEEGAWGREGLFKVDAIIITEVKEKIYPTLIFLLFPSSSRKLFKLKTGINIENRELNA